MQHQSTAALVRAEQLPHCSVLLCKTGSQQALGQCKYTYADLLFIQVCSDATPKHCSTGQGRIASSLFCAALQNSLTAALCHCSYTFRSQQAQGHCKYTFADLLFMQVCSDATPKHCSTGQGRIASPLFSAALQNRLKAGTVSLQLHLCTFALHTGVQ